MSRFLILLMALTLVSSCGRSDPVAAPTPSPRTMASSPRPTSTAPVAPEQGVDVSHHQGPIQWPLVAGADIGFAYLKATEGASYVDPMFTLNATRAQVNGIRVGAYHFFRYCTPAHPQARHFSDVLQQTPTDLPPAVDVERDRCTLDRTELVDRVRQFIASVEQKTGSSVVLYVYPDVEAKYHLREEFPGNPQWVRSLGRRPSGNWWLWQRSDRANVPGIVGGVDLNLMRTP